MRREEFLTRNHPSYRKRPIARLIEPLIHCEAACGGIADRRRGLGERDHLAALEQPAQPGLMRLGRR